MEPGETPEQALARELEEELGIRGAAGDEIDALPVRLPRQEPDPADLLPRDEHSPASRAT